MRLEANRQVLQMISVNYCTCHLTRTHDLVPGECGGDDYAMLSVEMRVMRQSDCHWPADWVVFPFRNRQRDDSLLPLSHPRPIRSRSASQSHLLLFLLLLPLRSRDLVLFTGLYRYRYAKPRVCSRLLSRAAQKHLGTIAH
jgi:hypothetical protein